MEWLELTDQRQLEKIAKSATPSIIFKHSTRCHVSKFVKKDLELESILIPKNVSVYLLDLLKFRALSDQVSNHWQISHESPQLLLIVEDSCVYHASHNHIHIADFVAKV